MKENNTLKSDVPKYIKLIEEVIKSLGPDPLKARAKKPGHWVLHQGKIPIWIYLTYIPLFKEYHIQVSAPIIKMPTQDKDAFSKQLISLNATLVGAAFMEKKGIVYMDTVREVINLDFEEARNLIVRIINYTNYYHLAKRNGLLNWPMYRTKNSSKPGPSSLS